MCGSSTVSAEKQQHQDFSIHRQLSCMISLTDQYLGLSINSLYYCIRLSEEQFRHCLSMFQLWKRVTFRLCLRLLRLMICDNGKTLGSVNDDRFSSMGNIAASLFAPSLMLQSENKSTVHGGSPVMEKTVCADVGRAHGGGVIQDDCNDGRPSVGVGHDADGRDSQWRLVPGDGTVSHKRAGDACSVFGTQKLSISFPTYCMDIMCW